MYRLNIVTFVILALLLVNFGIQVYLVVATHQPFTQYCDWVQPGKVLTCHR